MKVGILGGTFNPIHNGHLLIAENAYDQFNLDKVLIMPALIPPHKINADVLDAEKRCEMIKLAISNVPYFQLETREIEKTDISYSYVTLSEMKEENPQDELYFIMGADSLAYFKCWKNPDIILKNAKILVAVRDNTDISKLDEYKKEILTLFNGNIEYVLTPEFDVSSSEIRKRVSEERSIRYLVPESVSSFINTNSLYRR